MLFPVLTTKPLAISTNVSPSSRSKMTPSHTLVDTRGYIFKFPTLGLPDVAGEWHLIQAAITNTDMATPRFFDGPASAAAPRYPVHGDGLLSLEHDDAVWIVPLLRPQQAFPETELFTLQARRERLTIMPRKRRPKTVDGGDMFIFPHAARLPGFDFSRLTEQDKTPCEADEKAYWDKNLRGLLTLRFDREEPLPTPRSVVATRVSQKSELDDASEVERLEGWLQNPDSLLDQAWRLEAVKAAVDSATRAGTYLTPIGPAFAFGATPQKKGNKVRFQYAVSVLEEFKLDEVEWKQVPPHAFKPGAELKLVNQVRRIRGKEAMTQEELDRQKGL